MAASDLLQASFTLWSRTERRIKEFSKPREDPQKLSEKFRVLIEARDPRLPGLQHLVRVLVRPAAAAACHSLLQWIFLTQRSKPRFLYHYCHLDGVLFHSFVKLELEQEAWGSFLTRNRSMSFFTAFGMKSGL